MLKTIHNPTKSKWAELAQRPVLKLNDLFPVVQSVFDDIQKEGDKAVSRYSLKFDHVDLKNFRVLEENINAAENTLPTVLKKAIRSAYTNIYKFHNSQVEKTQRIITRPGVACWRENRAIEKVGIYIPGGTAPLFSTVLMLGIPAKIAGCKEMVLCTPPNQEGKIDPAILFTAKLVGVTSIFRIGGIQAIGALTFGTESVPKVDKIFGPGNQYVMAAKQWAQNCGLAIDMPAGPSEVLIIADQSCVSSFVAADLLSQAEHGPDSQVVLLSDSIEIVEKAKAELKLQLEQLPRKAIIEKALENSMSIIFDSIDQCMEFSNTYAPEHLIIATEKTEKIADKVVNAGSVFIGNYSCESAGDYASGTNHTLPTNGYAKAYSGVSVDSFVKKITFQKLSREGLVEIGETIEQMAAAEQLQAHKNAVSIRLNKIKEKWTLT